ncbi:Leukotriene A-4 hydrolase -like protein [Capsicum annuum]|nr:Leukotriene A-4 hydrolase -like protein [Capsicum annuum]
MDLYTYPPQTPLGGSILGFTLKQLPSETLFGKSAKIFNIAILRLLYDTIPFGDLFCMKGITTYAERRIIEAVQGEDIASLNIGIGWKGLVKEIERFKDNMEFTKLKTRQACVDPDDVYSVVPYEKGFQFLWRIERQIGRSAFDDFLNKYSGTFKFQSIDTDMFLNFLKANVPGIENKIDLKLWTEGTGIPPDAMEPVSNLYSKIVSLANEFKLGRTPREDEVADWKGQEWELYLKNLPRSVEASQMLPGNCTFCFVTKGVACPQIFQFLSKQAPCLWPLIPCFMVDFPLQFHLITHPFINFNDSPIFL